MARLACDLVATAAGAGAPDIIIFNDLENALIKVAHVQDRCPYILGDYATLEDADSRFPADFSRLTAQPLERRPDAGWYKNAVLMLMHIDLLPLYRSKMVKGTATGSVYTMVHIDQVWRLSTETDIWVKMISSLL